MTAYSSTKTFWDKATSPFVLGGWLLLPFFGAMTNVAHATDPDANTLDNLSTFYGPVVEDPVGSVLGFGTFLSDAAQDSTVLGEGILSGLGVDAVTGTAATAFNFATGAGAVGLGLYTAYKVTDAIFGAKPSPSAA